MYCRNCGKEIDDKAYVCPHCGVIQKNTNEVSTPSADGLSIAALVCSIVVSLVGLILSIISFNNHKFKEENDPSRKMSKIALIISIVMLSVSVLFSIIIISTGVLSDLFL